MRNSVLITITALVAVLLTPARAAAQVSYAPADSVLVEQLLSTGSTDPLFYAGSLLGRPYVGHTLELGTTESRLVVNTRELDCTTYVENVLALTICARKGQKGFRDYAAALENLRYRGGRRHGYASRLHYFSDWIADNERRGNVVEIQQPAALFAAEQRIKVGYMSAHPSQYKALKAHPDLVSVIAGQEKRLSGTVRRYIPREKVADAGLLRQTVADGDIIAITTSKAGLDIAHLGIARWKDGLHIHNASSIHGKVVLETLTLSEYLARHPSFTGIRVVRLKQ